MPQHSVPKHAATTPLTYSMLQSGAGILRAAQGETSTEQAQPRLRLIPARDADRVLSNVLTTQAWRNTTIEVIHAGTRPPQPLQPYQRRCTPATERRLLREVSAKLESIFFAFDDLFDGSSPREGLPIWPHTASALTSTLYCGWATEWSLEEISSPVVLHGTSGICQGQVEGQVEGQVNRLKYSCSSDKRTGGPASTCCVAEYCTTPPEEGTSWGQSLP
jgi:hypothetical protein